MGMSKVRGRLVLASLACSGLALAIPNAGKAQPSEAAGSLEQGAEGSTSGPAKAAANAPNIVVVMTDDVGFGASSTFGGPVSTPNLDRLANGGARFNNFHTTGMCSPTRAALLTGRNHHAVGTGSLTNTPAPYPGYTGVIPRTAASFARVLKDAGYNTAMFGKHHNVPVQAYGKIGPFTNWPTSIGFEEFYGFIGGETDQWNPELYHGTVPVEHRQNNVGILEADLTSRAIAWLDQQSAENPTTPFLIYYASGATHSPLQAPADYISRFRGQFDDGWDKLRGKTIARQIAAKIVPAGTSVSPRPGSIPAWDSLTPDQQRLYARFMEVYAGMLAYQDAQFGRLLDELQKLGKLDNTLVVFIEGDNGGSGEGGLTGNMNEVLALSGIEDKSFQEQLDAMPGMGGPGTGLAYPAGWGWALNAPFPYFKQISSHLGAIRNGLVISWPGHITAPSRMRTQFHHVIDIFPTLLEAAGVTAPNSVDGVQQQRVDGTSMLYTLKAPGAAGRRDTQYFEMYGNRAIYHDGWLANTNPERMPWEMSSAKPAEALSWSLYDLKTDFAQARDRAGSEPARLNSMKELFQKVGEENQVFPLRSSLAAPNPPKGANYLFRGNQTRLAGISKPNLALGFTATADLVVPEAANGAVLAAGSDLSGWSLYFKNGRAAMINRASSSDRDMVRVESSTKLAPGRHTVVFSYEPDRAAKRGGKLSISVDGSEQAAGTITKVTGILSGPSETFDVGTDTGRPVTNYAGDPAFTGTINCIALRVGKIPPEVITCP